MSVGYDRDEQQESHEPAKQAAQPERPSPHWASAIGNAAVQRIARSAAGQRAPSGLAVTPQTAAVLARQEDEEPAGEADAGGGGGEAEAAPEGGGEAGAGAEVGEEEKEE